MRQQNEAEIRTVTKPEREITFKSKNVREKFFGKEGGSFFCFKVLPYTVFSLVAGLIFRSVFYD